MYCIQYRLSSKTAPLTIQMWSLKTGGLCWQVPSYWNVGHAGNVGSFKTGGLMAVVSPDGLYLYGYGLFLILKTRNPVGKWTRVIFLQKSYFYPALCEWKVIINIRKSAGLIYLQQKFEILHCHILCREGSITVICICMDTKVKVAPLLVTIL